MRILSVLLIFWLFVSCEEAKEDNSSSSLEITSSGFTDFGKIRVGEFRRAAIYINNSSDKVKSLSISGANAPFSILGTKGDCTLSEISKNSECYIRIEYRPTDTQNHQSSITVNNKTILFKGKGLAPGRLQIGVSSWSAGNIEAGQLRTLSIPLSNSGDDMIGPPLVATSSFSVIGHNCGTEILPSETCQMILGVQKPLIGTYSETVQIYTQEMADYEELNFTATVTPSYPQGQISVTCDKLSLIADNTDTTSCLVGPLRDSFGNIASDGTAITASTQNGFIVGSNLEYTSSGMVNFTFRSSANIGNSRLIVSSNLASGYIDIPLTSGPPVGAITVASYQTQIRADGVSTVTLITDVMVNNSGVVVTDGTPIEAILDASGTIETAQLVTVGGKLSIKVRSSLIAETTNLTLRANHQGGSTYLASGTFPIEFIPLTTIGNFDVNCDDSEIYFDKLGSGLTEETICRIENIRDSNSNLVGAGVTIDVSIANGLNSTNGLANFQLTSDAASSASFVLQGAGVRDFITVDATIAGESNFTRVFAIADQEAIYYANESSRKVWLKRTFSSAIFDPLSDLSPSDGAWNEVHEDYGAIQDQDEINIGLKRYSGEFNDAQVTLRHFVWDCFSSVSDYIVMAPCEEKKVAGPGYNYTPYFMTKMRVEDSAKQVIGANFDDYPSTSAGIGEMLMHPISFYEYSENKIHMLGGVYTQDLGADSYELYHHEDGVTYGLISLFSYMPMDTVSYNDNFMYPIVPSYSKSADSMYIFGGARIISAPSRTIELGNTLQVFTEGDLTTVTVIDSGDGIPSPRVNNGILHDEDNNTVYIVGGYDSLGVFLDEIWKVDLDNVTPEWERVCSSCSIPELTQARVANMRAAIEANLGINFYYDSFEANRFASLIKDYDSKKVYLTAYRSNFVYEIDLETGSTQTPTDTEFNSLAGSDFVFQHRKTKRYYRYMVNAEGASESKLEYMDSTLGKSIYYQAIINLDEEALNHAAIIKPIVSAYSMNKTIGDTSITEYGVDAYIYNHSTNAWVLLGQNLSNSQASLQNSGFNITQDISSNPRDYIGEDYNVNILIRPTQNVGHQLTGINPGESELLINLIKLEGIY